MDPPIGELGPLDSRRPSRDITGPIDYRLRNEGTLVLLWAVTNAAEDWCNEHLPEDATRWGSAYVIEGRYAKDILMGMTEDGLVGALA